VQRPFPLPDGSLIRLTTARYYTPSGRSIQRPYKDGVEEYYKDITERYSNGEMISADSISFPDSLRFETSKGRAVYGGGGIMPDVFFPWDSTWYSDFYADIRRSGVMNQFSVEYVDENRKEIEQKYKNAIDLRDNFNFEEEIKDDFLAMVEVEEIAYEEEGWNQSAKTIEYQLKALIARNVWDIDSYYQVIYQIDDELQKTVDILNDGSRFSELKLN